MRQIDDPDGGTSLTTYDPAGNVATTTNGRGQVTLYEYDLLDRLTRIKNDAGQNLHTVGYEAQVRQPTETSTGTGHISAYEYDGFGRTERMMRWVIGVPTLITDFEYDLLGRTTRIDYPSQGSSVTYGYEGAYLRSVCAAPDLADCVQDETRYLISAVTYDALGRPDLTTLPPGVLDHDYFDSSVGDVDRLEQVVLTASDPSVPQTPLDFSYQYDALGNVTEIVDAHSADSVDGTASFVYDHRNRLWQRTIAGETRHFTYDALGNLVGRDLMNAGGSNQTFSPTRPHAVTQSHLNTTYAYDDDGNVSRRTPSAGPDRHFTYDRLNRLTCVGTSAQGCDVVQFAYAFDGERIAEIDGVNTRVFAGDHFEWAPSTYTAWIHVYAFGRRIATLTGTDVAIRAAEAPPGWPLPWPPDALVLGLSLAGLVSLVAWLAWQGALAGLAREPATAVLVLLVSASLVVPPRALAGGSSGSGGNWVTRWIFTDHLGSAVVFANDLGEVVRRRVFEPFGGVFAETGPGTTDRLFTDQRYQNAAQLYDFDARWYDPEPGVFTSVDPLIPDIADPQSFNAYSYVRNNPVNAVDPTGTDWVFYMSLGFGPESTLSMSISTFITFTLPSISPSPIVSHFSSDESQVGPSEPFEGESGYGIVFTPSPFGILLPGVLPGFSQERANEITLEQSIVTSAGAAAGTAAVACAAGGCQAASAAMGTATTRLGVELTTRASAAQTAIAGAAVKASDLARNASLRSYVAAEKLLSRSPILRGVVDGVKAATVEAELPKATSRGESRAQQVGILLGHFGDAFVDLFN